MILHTYKLVSVKKKSCTKLCFASQLAIITDVDSRAVIKRDAKSWLKQVFY